MLKNLLILATASVLFSGCFGEKEEENWTAFIYPDKENTKRSVKSPVTFKTLQECKDESIKQINNQNLQKSAIFKCGLNCGWHEGMQVEICQKMFSSVEK
ncbi:hypothetical protein GCM10012288_19510 [Malaciobacter pacificus]|uniref:Uncharacterized protein n=1 Tax=Malaciobacter pacificus TaxID=1080223 RepID=A0A5C2H6H2_9BACT|nr:hypothetical protein [Malaciobacter pacificus]QEP34413.1 hypothetical protein APAC_1296 [Malaciobacter pacificus]GGD45276.1 hypothetical protein GCM10012288_19510 [Malaciobacter pacificus]